jgi:hypothetical protein
MDTAWIGILGTVVGFVGGGIFSLINSRMNNKHQIELEYTKAGIARKDNLAKELRSQIWLVASYMMNVQYSMEWAIERNSVEKTNYVELYNREVHDIFPKLLGALAEVASLNEDAYKKLAALEKDLHSLDREIIPYLMGIESTTEPNGNPQSNPKLTALSELYKHCNERVIAMSNRILSTVSETLKEVEKTNSNSSGSTKNKP